MLTSLKINDLAIIEDAKIEYDSGLNVMTGETGSGKSIIIDSINAVRGERSSKELISDGAECARVSAVFENVSDKVVSVLADYDIDCTDGCVMIQRTIKENRNICKINGETVTVSVLKAVGNRLINIHGQNDNQTLLNEENHLGYIDEIADNSELLKKYTEKYNQLRSINRMLKKSTLDESEKERRLEALSYQINEIKGADIKIGEKDELTALKNRQNNIEKITDALNNAEGILEGSDTSVGILSQLYNLNSSLSALTDCYAEIGEYISSVEESISAMKDCHAFVCDELSVYNDSAKTDVNKIEERLDIIYRLSKKYGKTEEDILAYLDNAEKEYDDISLNEEKVNALTQEYNEVLDGLLQIADELTLSRKAAGDIFARRIMDELSFLDMPEAKFIVEITEGRVSANGRDNIRFLISTNVGHEPKPMSKIASGGELSRIMLAIKCVLTNTDKVDTLIFDEIDAGVSGRAAEKIGYKLKEVSVYSQVICVTHLAQIAAFADNHLFIEKITSENKTRTQITDLDFEARKAEIARIMGGSLITDSTLKGAEEMLKRAANFIS